MKKFLTSALLAIFLLVSTPSMNTTTVASTDEVEITYRDPGHGDVYNLQRDPGHGDVYNLLRDPGHGDVY